MGTATVDTERAEWRARIRDSRLGTLAVLAVTAVLVLGGIYLVDHRTSDGGVGVSSVTLTGAIGRPPVVGKPAQDFTATTVDGQQVALSGYRGHPVWLTFGASWCAACRAEAPDIQQAYVKAKADGLVVVQVFITEDSTTVKGYGERVGLSYTKIADPDTRIASMYRVLGIPAHFFIDRSGILRQARSGSLTPATMDAAIAEIIR
jgi:cytochrome c biogenesis protein CcmG/thiol:disulfide interchange protein DsbE